ncbi:MAG TPA: septum site-determining protein MinC, partial [Clostridium sp.]
IITRSPEDEVKPQYPEVAKIKNGNIIVEPYLANKYI